MPLDPHAKALLDLLVAAQRPKTWQLTPPEAREGITALAQVADVKGVPIGAVRDGWVRGAAGDLPYRGYTPLNAGAGRLPGMLYLHGGGFVIGSIDTHDSMCRALANASGCRIISLGYRLAPEHKFPAAVEDGFAALMNIGHDAEAYGLDPLRIAVGGDSAGANLAAVLCQLARQAGGPRIALQLLFCPRTDAAAATPSLHAYASGYLLEQKSIEWFAAHYGATDPYDPRVSPLRAQDLEGLPEAHIHTAEFDPLRDEGEQYAARLAASGVTVRYTCHAGMIHHFYALAAAIPYAKVALANAGAAIKDALA
jgi:acetyl esterase/lipase